VIREPGIELDLIVTAERVDTGERGPGGITALGVRAGRVALLGTAEDAARWSLREDGARHDFAGATVCAGLSDPHTHPVHGLLGVRGIDLGEVRDPATLAAALAAEAGRLGPGQWVIGWNLRPEAFGGDPSRAPLDQGCPENPVFIRLFDFHAAVANTRALAAAGVTGASELPGTSEVVVDAEGRPTGYLKEFPAMRLVESAAPEQSVRERADALLALLREMAATGITSTHSLTYDASCAETVELIESETELPLRVRFSPVFRNEARDGDYSFEEIVALQGTGGRDWGIEGVKFFLDGTIDNGTAWLREADALGESSRSIWDDPERYSEALRAFHAAGIATATHAIGDAAVLHALRTIATLPASEGAPRHRIEHIEVADDELVRAFAASGAIASMQPAITMLSLGEDGSSHLAHRLGDRHEQLARVRSFIEAGVVVAFGSDWPIGPSDPRIVMAMARTRRSLKGGTAPLLPGEAVTARQALTAYTEAVGAIYGDEGLEGVIAPGARADLTVFATDPLTAEPEDLVATPVLATYVGGRRV